MPSFQSNNLKYKTTALSVFQIKTFINDILKYWYFFKSCFKPDNMC